MSDPFFDHPILNSPYEYPRRHWELDDSGQPTQRIIDERRTAKFITPIPKPKKRKATAQKTFVFDEGKGLSSEKQQYDTTSTINEVRSYVDTWRALPNPNQWQVAPETARLLQHWRKSEARSIRQFFCQVEAVETAIWLTEVAPHSRNGQRVLTHLGHAPMGNAQTFFYRNSYCWRGTPLRGPKKWPPSAAIMSAQPTIWSVAFDGDVGVR